MTHIKGSKDADLHFDDGSGQHYGTAPTTDGRDLERFERRIKAHLNAHAAEESELATVDQETVYVWLTQEESQARELPARVGLDDMWLTMNEALSHKGRSGRAEDARWLVVAHGRTRHLGESLLA
jgi:hypothetical protein